MLSYNSIQSAYPVSLHSKGRFIIREYLQYKLLEIIYTSVFASKLIFLGGTNLRIVHGNQRFSEDLDFDNKGMSTGEFDELAELIVLKLSAEGYQVDTESQNYTYEPNLIFLNKFDVFTQIYTTTLETLLAQKYYAVLNRPRNKGRDFYDIVFILSKIKEPDYSYLDQKLGIKTSVQLKEAILRHCSTLNMNEMANDVAPFLFQPSEVIQIQHFPSYLQSFL
jgi:predicted nucleotidyltransferase component of viral defense system